MTFSSPLSFKAKWRITDLNSRTYSSQEYSQNLSAHLVIGEESACVRIAHCPWIGNPHDPSWVMVHQQVWVCSPRHMFRSHPRHTQRTCVVGLCVHSAPGGIILSSKNNTGIPTSSKKKKKKLDEVNVIKKILPPNEIYELFQDNNYFAKPNVGFSMEGNLGFTPRSPRCI